MKKLNIDVEQFLQPFFSPDEKVCIRLFSDSKKSGFKGQKLDIQMGNIGQYINILKEHNKKDRGIFFVVNYGGNEDKDITRINAQFVENDNLSIEEQYGNLMEFELEPSLIVKTKKSLHGYWLIKNGNIDKFRTVQAKLAEKFDGDKTIVNESRVLRIPGFEHRKEEPIMVECIKYNPELRYTQEELEMVLPDIVDKNNDKNSLISASGTRKGLTMITQKCEFLKHCGKNAKKLSEHDWYAMISNLAVFEGGSEVIHKLSTGYPQYSKSETDNKIKHYFDSKTKPITCTTIAEKGYKCPKLKDKSCGCKAPAAMCFKPLEINDLKKFLKEKRAKKDSLENINAAEGFVVDYLYNVEPVTAESFINYEIKSYYNLKAADIKVIISLYKLTHKNYKSDKETKGAVLGLDLPDWYEVSDRGTIRFLPGVLADYMAKNVNTFYCAEKFFVYENGVYSETSDLKAKNMVRELMLNRYTTLNNIIDAEGQWRMQIIKPVREINSNPYIINLRNGLYNILDDTFKEHTPKFISTVQLNVNYTPGAKCKRFIKFLEESLGKDEVALVQEMLGYFLIPVNKAQKSFIVVGEPGAGKSKLLLTLNEILLGQENVSNVPWQSLNDRFKTAELFGKLANIFADLPTKNIDDNGIFKALVGEDFLTVERKNKDPFSFQPYTRLLFSCNAIPRNYGDKSEGFYRRLIIIRFSQPVPENKRDNELFDKFRDESDGIFMFAAKGLKRLIENNFKFSETSSTIEELKRYRVDSNSVLSFVEDCCEIESNAEIARNELFNEYKEYCQNSGLSPVSQKNFNRDVEHVYTTVKRGVDKVGRRRVWKGIKLSKNII